MKTIEYKSFSGYNDTASPDNLKDTELSMAKNVDLMELGSVPMRRGCIKLNEASYCKKVLRLFPWYVSDQERLLALMYDGATYSLARINKNTGAIDAVIYESSREIHPFIHQNKVYFTDGVKFNVYGWFHHSAASSSSTDVKAGEIVFNLPGSTGGGIKGRFYKALADKTITPNSENYGNAAAWEDVTDIEGFISCRVIEVKPKDGKTDCNLERIAKCTMFTVHEKSLRVFAAGNPDDPTAIYFSEVSQINYFKETAILYPSGHDLGRITGLVSIIGIVLVAYEDGWQTFSGMDIASDAEWKKLAVPYGCVAPRSIVLTPYSITFLGKSGIYTMSVGALSQDAIIVQSKDVINNLSKDTVENTLSKAVNNSNVFATYYDNKYMIAFDDEEGRKILVYDWDQGGFVLWTGIDANDFYSDETGILYGCDNYILKGDEGHSDIDVLTGEKKPIHYYVETKSYDFGEGITQKDVSFMYLSFSQQDGDIDISLGVKLVCDYGSVNIEEIDITDAFNWGRSWGKTWGYSDLVQKEIEIKRIASRFKLILENNKIDNNLVFYGVSYMFRTLRPGGTPVIYDRRLLE